MITIKNKYHYDCDVLIIGGGPAGSGLAYHLGKAGIKVIVAEAEKFPRDKVCGDGVSPVALAELHAMGITSTGKFAEANEINKVGLFIKADKVLINLSKPEHLPLHARIIPRIELDHWIYDAAKNVGAHYLEETRFGNYTIDQNGVATNLKQRGKQITIVSKLIVGADGSSSGVARQFHGAKAGDQFQLLGLRAYFDNVKGPTDRVDIYFAKESFPGIYWMFPKGERGANIGMAMVSATLPHNPAHVKQLLQNHINSNQFIKERIGDGAISGKISGWPISFFNADKPITGNRILFVGDAAGLINPLSGDGIQYALLSARWASETLVACIGKNDFSAAILHRYRKKVDEELAYDFSFSNLIVQFSRNKTLSSIWMEIIGTLVARAKNDKEYADIIAGIFEGTYPSYKALNFSFILKSLMQGGTAGLQELTKSLLNPLGALHTGINFLQSATNIFEEIKDHSKENGKWVGAILKNSIAVAGHTVNHIIKTKRHTA